jgi:hypothetical protein
LNASEDCKISWDLNQTRKLYIPFKICEIFAIIPSILQESFNSRAIEEAQINWSFYARVEQAIWDDQKHAKRKRRDLKKNNSIKSIRKKTINYATELGARHSSETNNQATLTSFARSARIRRPISWKRSSSNYRLPDCWCWEDSDGVIIIQREEE